MGYFSMLVLLVGFAYLASTRAMQVTASRCDWPMLLLGMGFMLLETKLIAKLALLLSATWVVNTFVISAVLVMVFLSNLAVMRQSGHNSLWAIAAVLLFLFADWTIRLDTLSFSTNTTINLGAILLLLAAPVFFAGMVFSNIYRLSRVPSVAFGYNLLGAMIGGVMEYCSTFLGINNLNLLCMAIYSALAVVLIREVRERAAESKRLETTVQNAVFCRIQPGDPSIPPQANL